MGSKDGWRRSASRRAGMVREEKVQAKEASITFSDSALLCERIGCLGGADAQPPRRRESTGGGCRKLEISKDF